MKSGALVSSPLGETVDVRARHMPVRRVFRLTLSFTARLHYYLAIIVFHHQEQNRTNDTNTPVKSKLIKLSGCSLTSQTRAIRSGSTNYETGICGPKGSLREQTLFRLLSAGET